MKLIQSRFILDTTYDTRQKQFTSKTIQQFVKICVRTVMKIVLKIVPHIYENCVALLWFVREVPG